MTPKQTVIIGSRTIKLALWQTDYIIEQLQEAWPDMECRIVPVVTKGDKTLDTTAARNWGQRFIYAGAGKCFAGGRN